MSDKVYCYPNSNVLVNKLGLKDAQELFSAESELTYIRLQELSENPIRGNFDLKHLQAIHRYIFQDIYDWAGKIRTLEIGKGNLFCLTGNIVSFAQTIFDKYYAQCYSSKDRKEDFVRALANNYGDLNALHPFR